MRGYISPKLKLQVLVAQGGRCARVGCGVKLGKGNTEFDHVLPVWQGGLTEMGNLECLCVPHHAEKTANDARDRAKVKRLQRANNTTPTDDSATPKRRKRRIVSAGFSKTLRKRMDGKVEARR